MKTQITKAYGMQGKQRSRGNLPKKPQKEQTKPIGNGGRKSSQLSVSVHFSSMHSTSRGSKTVFLIWSWKICGCRGLTVCIHWSMTFHIRDSSIRKFWYSQRILEPVFLRYWGTVIIKIKAEINEIEKRNTIQRSKKKKKQKQILLTDQQNWQSFT